MPITNLLLCVIPLTPAPQDPAPGEVGKFRWPPTDARTLRYKASFTKERKLPKDIEKKEKAARKAAGLYAPSRSPRQGIAIGMEILLDVTKDGVVGTYTTTLGKQSLRMDVPKRKKTRRTGTRGKPVDASARKSENTAPLLGNSRIGWVWGLPSSKGEENMQVERGSIERTFEHTFKKADQKGTEPGEVRKQFGDHLIPVLWTYPLPCWIGALVSTMDLGGEAVIAGKRLIRDGTQHFAFGYRHTHIDGMWTKASSAGFTLTYKLKIEQFVSQGRDGRPLTGETTKWFFDVEGLATYSFRDQAWETITETVRARPGKLADDKLRALLDEFFAGTIKIQRVRETKGKKRRRR